MDLYNVRNQIQKGIPIEMLNLKVVFYARVSTDKDAQLHSLSHQVSFFEDYIKKNINWEYVGSYIDEGISGTKVKNRENFIKMIDDAKNKKFDLILTKEISRFSRNTLDSIKYTQELLQNGVGVYFLNDNINTVLPDAELRLTIMSSIAQDEVRKLSERVKFGMKRSIENGVVLGSSNIYGYVKNKGTLVIDPVESEMVEKIFTYYGTTNISLNGLSKKLYDEGYRNSKGNKINVTVIKRIIENPKYKGMYCGNKTTTLDYLSKQKIKLKESEWIKKDNHDAIPSIISKELWDLANNKLLNVKKSFKNKSVDKEIFSNRYTYSGKIFCGIHNETYHRCGSGNRKNNPVWECQIYRKNGVKGCNNRRLKTKELDMIFKKIINHSILRSYVEEIISYCEEFINKKRIKVKQVKMNNIDLKRDKLIELYIDGYIKKEELDLKLKTIESNSKEIITLENNYDLNLISSRLYDCLENNDCFSSIFKELINKITVYKEKTRIEFNDGNVTFV